MNNLRQFLFCLALLFATARIQCQPTAYPLLLQPELDDIDLDEYFKDDIRMERQIDCVLQDGPCDEVGRWLKPRVPAAFIGNCQLCTEKQAASMPRIMAHMQEHRPEEYRNAVRKYIMIASLQMLG